MGVGARVKAGTTKMGLLLCVVMGVFAVPSIASAEVSFCPPGSGAGQCNEPGALATDFETGRLYVADRFNNRVDVFEADGTFLFAFGWGVDTGSAKLETCTTASTCQAGIGGAAAGQFAKPNTIAVDNFAGSPTRHDVYVGTDNFRVQRFKPDGTFVLAFGWGVDTGAKELQSCTTASTCQAGNAVANGEINKCQITGTSQGIAVGPGGNVFLADAARIGLTESEGWISRVEKFSAAGACLGETKLFGPAPGHTGQLVRNLAVDSAEDAYVIVTGGQAPVSKYDLGTPETKECDLELDIETRAITLDEAGDLFALQSEIYAAGGSAGVVAEYDASCVILRRFGYGIARFTSIAAFHSVTGDVFSDQSPDPPSGINYFKAPPPGPIVAPPSVKANPVGNTKATLKADINPEGKATSYHVEYLTREAFEGQGDSFSGPGTKSTPVTPLSVPTGREFRLNAAEAQLGCPVATQQLKEEGKCLEPETEYRYRVVATNADGEGPGPVSGTFTTKAAIDLGDVYVTEVGTDTATIHAEANPLGIPATGYFEFVDKATYQASGFAQATKVPDVEAGETQIDLGSAETSTTHSVTLYPLQAGTTYRYRLAATDPFLAEPLRSKEGTFITLRPSAAEPCPENEALRTGASALLPDCRAYEMVSPLDKAGGDIVVLGETTTGEPATLNQSSSDGAKLAYGSYRSFADPQAAPYTTQYIAARTQDGWRSHAISPPRLHLVVPNSLDSEFRAFSPDLCQAWLTSYSDPPLAAGAIAGYQNVYRRSDSECGGEASYEALTTVQPPNSRGLNEYIPTVEGLSADGTVAALTLQDSLTEDAPPQSGAPCIKEGVGCDLRLYVQGGGQLRFACVLPSGGASESPCLAGGHNGAPLNRYDSVANALSADGSRLYWTDTNSLGGGHIYLRENPLAPDSAHLLGQAKGTGDLTGLATCTGNLNTTVTVKKVKCSGGSLSVGQEITGPEGIAAGSTIVKIEEPEPGVFTATLSKATTKVIVGATLTGAASAVVSNVQAESGAFAVGQEITAADRRIPPGTTISKVEKVKSGPDVFRLTLSAIASGGGAGVALSSSSKCTEPEKACTIPVSRAGEEEAGISSPFGASRFRLAAEDGSAAFYAIGNSLYEFELGGEVTRKVAGGVVGLMGASEDAKRVYFGSTEVLSGEEENSAGQKAKAGQVNLYLYEAAGGGGLRFVAGPISTGSTGALDPAPWSRTARVSADGLHAAFMSAASLTGYDNTDAASPEACGKPKGVCDSEVFVYDASANGSIGKLLCASCNPSGARPAGGPYGGGSVGRPRQGAARIPGWENILYASQVLSEDGARLFFESQDALTPRDTNGRIDVYEWEALDNGGCTDAAPSFSATAGGCIDLISSGQSLRDSAFVDASPDGQDVFFTTLSSLLRRDYGLVDIYDARAGGGLAPEAQPPAECEGEACQSAPEAPDDPTPASASFEGAGNVREEAAAPVRKQCAKGKVKRHGRCVAKKKHAHKRRAARNKGRAAR